MKSFAKSNRFKASFTGQTEAKDKSQVGEIGKQAFRECVLWISKQMITLSCDGIEPAAEKKGKERLITGYIRKKKTSAQM